MKFFIIFFQDHILRLRSVFFQNIRQNTFSDALIHSQIHGFFLLLSLCDKAPDLRQQYRKPLQPFAPLHQLLIMPVVDVQKHRPAFDRRLIRYCSLICLAHTHDPPVGFILFAVIKHNELRHRKRDPLCAVQIRMIPEKLPVQLCEIQKSPQRHIRIHGTLLLIQIELTVEQERYIISYPHVHGILNRIDLYGIGIRI